MNINIEVKNLFKKEIDFSKFPYLKWKILLSLLFFSLYFYYFGTHGGINTFIVAIVLCVIFFNFNSRTIFFSGLLFLLLAFFYSYRHNLILSKNFTIYSFLAFGLATLAEISIYLRERLVGLKNIIFMLIKSNFFQTFYKKIKKQVNYLLFEI